MTTQTQHDVLIIGSGMAGLAAANAARAAGLSTLVMDKGRCIGGGSPPAGQTVLPSIMVRSS